MKPLIFVSYSHLDNEACQDLQKHLKTLVDNGRADLWVDHRISAGDKWELPILENLEKADIIILLLSPNFINSDYCLNKEMKRAFERANNNNARVIPLLFSSFLWKEYPDIQETMLLPKGARPIDEWDNRNAVWTDVVSVIAGILNDGTVKSNRKSKRPAGSLISYLPNRDKQGKGLSATLQKIKDDRSHEGKPVLLIAHGTSEDSLEKYVERLCHRDIPDFYRSTKPIEHEHLVGKDGITLEDWWIYFCNRYTQHHKYDKEGKEEARQKIDHHLGVNHHLVRFELTTSVLSNSPSGGVETCIEFAQQWGKKDWRHQLIFVITICYDPPDRLWGLIPRKDKAKAIRKYLATLNAQQYENKLILSVLPEMETVKQPDVVDWSVTHKTHLKKDLTERIIRDIYADKEIVEGDKGIRMENLAAKLSDYLVS